MNLILLLPILIPLTTGATCLLAWHHRVLQRRITVVGSIGSLGAAIVLFTHVQQKGIQAVQIGNWPAPYGITLVADLFGASMVVLAGTMGFVILIYSLFSIDTARESFGYYPLTQILQMGVCGAFLTGDIFNLYVWFEVLLMASFVLMALGGERAQMEGALKYVALNLMSSTLFLAAVGILYGVVGTLNMADLSIKLHDAANPALIITLAMMFLVAFGIKAAIFPLFFWLPASYHTPPPAVSALFAALLTKVGVYSLIRVFTLLFLQETTFTHTLILVLSALTMVVGVLGAAAQTEFRRILSFHSVSQVGYMIMGLGLLTPLALAGSLFFLFHHGIVKSNLFLISGIVHRLGGTYDLKKLGGIYKSHLGLAILFLITALSLAGLPPLSGFFAKLALIKAGLDTGEYAVVAVALGVSLLTLFSMTKIWAEVFWKPAPAGDKAKPENEKLMLLPVLILCALTIGLGLGAGPVFETLFLASHQLLDPSEYVRAVLGDTP